MNIIERLIRADQPESTHRAIALVAALVLCGATVIVALAIWWQAVLGGEVSTQLVAALSVLVAALAGLAGTSYVTGKKEPSA